MVDFMQPIREEIIKQPLIIICLIFLGIVLFLTAFIIIVFGEKR